MKSTNFLGGLNIQITNSYHGTPINTCGICTSQILKNQLWPKNHHCNLTYKTPCVSWPNFAVIDIVEEMIFSKNKNMRTWEKKP
jgi:adenosylmethionine-8-amino-7-oxononanoate aminotransferase